MITYTKFVSKYCIKGTMIDDLDAVIAAAVQAEREAMAKSLPLTIKTAIETEREACAKIADEKEEWANKRFLEDRKKRDVTDRMAQQDMAASIAAAIRARNGNGAGRK